MDQDADIRFRVKHDVPIFNRPFSQVAEEYADAQQRRANAGEVSQARAMYVKNKINGPLNAYVGSTQIHLVSQDRWSEYPLWRRENGVGRRNGIVSDSTIRIEMTILAAIMNYAVSKRYVPARHRFEGMPKLKSARRDAFTLEEYRKLHSVGRKWMKEATTPQGVWYRQVSCNIILIMCNTGMRPPEAKNLRWRDLARSAMGLACTAVATAGFRSLSASDQSSVRELIETFDAFDEDNDPHGERDFGTIYQLGDGRWTTERPRVREDERERVFWKLDYYDRDLQFGSEDAANPAQTRRFLTIMLSDEY
jgi:Protein of unknown function (DUF3768)